MEHSFYVPVFVDWLPPKENETLQAYALRLKEAYIPDDAIIVGLSFGGMLATEIAKQFPLSKAILLSSAKTSSELPPYYRIGKLMPFHKWTPYALQKWFMLRIKWLFGISSKQAEQIYEDIIKRSDPRFNTWAVDAILNWKNEIIPRNIVHVHGTRDRILPHKYVNSDFTVKGGGHLMVLEQAGVISNLIRTIIVDNPILIS